MSIVEIKDFSSPELDVFARLTEAQLRNRLEAEKGVFIAESPKVIKLALNAGYEPVSLLMSRKHIVGQGKELIDKCGDIPVYTADSEILTKLTGFRLTRGILCCMRRKVQPAVEDICIGANRIAVLENIADSTNVGAIFRSAAALNFDAVLVTHGCCDPSNRRAVRVSMGTVFQVPWAYIGKDINSWPCPGMQILRDCKFSTAAMTLSDDSISIDDPRLSAEKKLAVILGSEGDGLVKDTVAQCDYKVRIPMSHGVDSLNVAAAGAVAFWQLRVR